MRLQPIEPRSSLPSKKLDVHNLWLRLCAQLCLQSVAFGGIHGFSDYAERKKSLAPRPESSACDGAVIAASSGVIALAAAQQALECCFIGGIGCRIVVTIENHTDQLEVVLLSSQEV